MFVNINYDSVEVMLQNGFMCFEFDKFFRIDNQESKRCKILSLCSIVNRID
jgi:hypothetical protein